MSVLEEKTLEEVTEEVEESGAEEAAEAERAVAEEEVSETETTAAEEETPEGSEAETEDTLAQLRPYLDSRIERAIQEMGFVQMTPIQIQTIPPLMEGRDIIGQAQTGTGKTAAFGIPIIQKVNPDDRSLQAIILCPTRELAVQAAEELRRLAKYMQGVKVIPVYGGQDISRQINGLKGTQIVVGTPGRVMDHMRRHTLKLDNVRTVILDEADEMLDMGFREDMELILGSIPGEHQTALFSATMPKPILDLTEKFQKDAQFIRVASKELTIPLVSQHYYRIRNKDKDAACIRILEYYQPKLCLIFCNTKIKVDELTSCLKQHGLAAEGLHGDMSQAQRDVAMKRFRNGTTGILIATDVAARGIDVENVEAVINYDVPQDIEYYVHRIGRTGRAGKTGSSYTFVNGREVFRIRQIEKFCNTTIDEWNLPGTVKVQKVKAEKFLDDVMQLKDAEDLDLMKKYISRRIEQEGCEALDMAALLLKYYVGDKGEEIEVDEGPERRKREDRGRRRRGERGSEGREGRSGEKEERSRSRRRSSGEPEERSRSREAYSEDREERFGEKEERSRDRKSRFEEKEERSRDKESRFGSREKRKAEEERSGRRKRDDREKDGWKRDDWKKDDRKKEDRRKDDRKKEERKRDDREREKDRKDVRLKNREERRREMFAGKAGKYRDQEDYEEEKSAMKRGKTSERGSRESWWNTGKLPFSTREHRKKR